MKRMCLVTFGRIAQARALARCSRKQVKTRFASFPLLSRQSPRSRASGTLARCSRKLKKRTLPRQAQFSFHHFYFLSFQIPDPLPLFHCRAFRLFSKIRRDLLHSSRLYDMERTALIAVTAGDTVGSMFFQCRVVVRRHRIPGNSFNCQSICFFTFSRFVVQPYSPVS